VQKIEITLADLGLNTFMYRDFTFIVLVFSIIVDTCIAGPVRVVVGPALNTVM